MTLAGPFRATAITLYKIKVTAYEQNSTGAFTFVKQNLCSGVRYNHVLVTVSRIWAVTFPLHYRTAHSKLAAN
ncbi:hypothetical protein BV898_13364 [Hypsibius exemplaris]|uniref:Uncharacterized protein n=1 Tax=Hypsibius exemplaris TaxID=2072580 RepID=A0A1W0WAT3_HYPEX|nr:hypothetical protein BV898_13364 [Hypsibius exemplaris]